MPDTANYFAFYGLPEAFLLDSAALKAKYYQLSRELHPDFHARHESFEHLGPLGVDRHDPARV